MYTMQTQQTQLVGILISGEGDCGEGDCGDRRVIVGRVIVGRVNGYPKERPLMLQAFLPLSK